MKRYFFLGLILCLAACSKSATSPVPAEITNMAVSDNVRIAYLPDQGKWSFSDSASDEIAFVKQASNKLFSEYMTPAETMTSFPTTYEFLSGNKFIGYNSEQLKFYKFIYMGGNINPIPLQSADIAALFPKTEIVPVSAFVDGKLKVKRLPFAVQKILILNDTSADFSGYSFENYTGVQSPIKGLIVIDSYDPVVFSSSKENAQPLTIEPHFGW